MKHILCVIVILIVSVITGVAAKAVWYDQWSPTKTAPAQKMAWVKQSAADSTARATSDLQPAKSNDADSSASSNKQDDNAGAQDASVQSTNTNATPANDEPEYSGGYPVAKLDMVVDHLTNGTAFFVDAREEYEFDEGHLKGAHLLPSSAIYENIENLMAVGLLPGAAGKPIIVYCGGGSCEASHNVAKVMTEFDYQNIWIYVNGWEEVMSETERFAGLTE